MKKALFLAVLILSNQTFAKEQYSLNGETMECRINQGNGIPAVLVQLAREDALVMNFQEKFKTFEAYYVQSDLHVQITYNDSEKKDSVQMFVPLRNLNIERVKYTAITTFVLGGVKTNVTCNVRDVSAGIPIPPPPIIR